MNKVLISPSLLSADFGCLKDDMDKINRQAFARRFIFCIFARQKM